MADRYWILGTGSWSSTNTVNWSDTSGGTGGFSVPTAADNVYFDANSNVGTGAFTVTMANTPRVCNDFTASGLDGVMTLAGTSIGLTVSGSLTFQATNFAASYSGATTFNATTTGKTVTTNGIAFSGAVTFNGVGGAWTLGSALNVGNNFLTITAGTFDTSVSNYAVTTIQFQTSTTTVKTINLNGSTVTVTGTGSSGWSISSLTGLTFNAGTSTIANTGASSIFTGGGATYYNVSFTSAAITSISFNGTNTLTNLNITGRTTIGIGTITLGGNQTISGTLTVSAGTGAAYRTMITSDLFSFASYVRTLTCAAVSLTDVDFRGIVFAGAASPATGTRLGNCAGNTNITFPAAKTVYYGQTGSNSWGVAGSGSWSATSGGALDATQFPLAQDTAVFPAATYPASGSTTTINASYNIGTIDMSLRTSNTMTLVTGSNAIYGNWINGTGITLSNTGTLTFAGQTTQQITSAGIPFTQGITINTPSGSVTLQDAFTTNILRTTSVTVGTLNLQSFTLTTGLFSSSVSDTRTIAFGTGNITCSGTGTVWTTQTTTGLTTTGTQVVNVTSTGSTAITVRNGNLSEANSISFNFTGGTYTLAFLQSGTTTARNVNFTGYAGTLLVTDTGIIYGNLTLSSGMTLTASTSAMTFGATSGTKQITTNAKTIDFPLTFNGVGGTFQLQDALTMGSTRTATLTSGTLNLQSFTLSAGLFSSSNSNTRTIAFGTGQISCTGTGTVWTTSTVTGLTTTGTQVVNVTSVGSTAITVTPGGLSEANSISFNFTGGTYALTFLASSSHSARNVDFTGYAGTWAGPAFASVIYGNLKLSTGMTLTPGANDFYFGATSGTKTITSNTKTLPYPVVFTGVGGTWQLLDAMTLGSSNAAALTNGTLDLNGFTLTASNIVINAGTKNITFNGGTLLLTSGGSFIFWNANPTGFTTTAGTGVGTISMTAATAKTFVGGGSTFNCTLNQGGAGDLTITGSNTFSNITNTVQPASVLFTAATTSTFTSFSLSGTAGNLITIGSVTAASHTLSKASGTVSVSFCSISRSNGTGGATWEALTSNGNVDGGNNTGWSFGGVIYAAVIAETATATDSPSVAASTFNAPVAETATATDSVLSFADFYAALSEAATATDSVISFADFYAALAETATATDAILGLAAFSSALAETATATDAILGLAAFSSALAETATATDSPSVAASTFNAPVTDTATATDSVLGLAAFSSALAETATATDSDVGFILFPVSITETATATDAILGGLLFVSAVTNTATATDNFLVAPSTFNAPVTNTATATDAYSVAATFNALVFSGTYDFSESTYILPTGTSFAGSAIWSTTALSRVQVNADGPGTGTAGFSAGGNYIAFGIGTFGTMRLQTQTISLVGASLITLNYINGTGSNGGVVPGSVLQIAAYDSNVFTNTLGSIPTSGQSTFGDISFAIPLSSRVVNGSIRLVSVVQAGGANYGLRNITITYDGTKVTDSFSAAQFFSTQIVDATTATDTFLIAPSTFNAPFVDTTSITDAITSTAVFISAITDTATITDAITSTAVFISAITDTATITDVFLVAPSTFNAPVAETATITDVFLVAPSTFNAPFVDTATITDVITNAGSIYNVPVFNTATATDVFIGSFLWNLIDDSQTIIWTPISTDTPTTWNLVDDTTPTTWQNINNVN